jgi:hypothetical protein
LITDVKLMETSVPPQTSRQPFPIACETPSSDVIEDANSLFTTGAIAPRRTAHLLSGEHELLVPPS